MCRNLWIAIGLCVVLATSTQAAEINYLEDFALAKDRAEAIKLLIPGSESYYYYQCLHLQQLQQFDQVNPLVQQWINRYGRTPLVIEIQLRQALLTYEKNPKESLEFVRQHLHLEFNHQREVLGEKPNLPSELDQQLISRERLTQDAINRVPNLDGFEDSALDWLVAQPLDPDRRRNLLQRLARPDYPNLVKLVVDDLNHVNSQGFGAMGIHRQLLLPQLDECLKLKLDLLNQANFVNTYLAKLQPNADIDWQHDAKEKEAYLDRLWAFVQRLAPVHNSLKAHVLYHRLAHDRTQGLYDKQRFMTYIRLPRNVGYIAKSFIEQSDQRQFVADLAANFQPVTLMPPIGTDDPLVREYLQHFFVEENTTKPYEPFINDVFLKHIFAETKIVNGLGNPEQWYSLLPPEQYQALKERIDLDFAATNRTQFTADEPVAIDLFVKNVRTLIVKVFDVNARNFYQQNLREVNTDINLDGLVANDEQTYDYTEPPLRRVRRHFEFPSLARPGVYVVDFIGNGMSSRVVIRKGQLRHLVRTSTAGHVFTILDEQNKTVPDATLWLAGHEYKAGKDGHIVVPFTDKPARQPIVLSRGALSCLDSFSHESETYSLAAGIYVDRESLLARRNAEVVIRPSLYVNGTPVTLSVLEDIKLRIASIDQDGVSTVKDVSPFVLLEDREASFEFQTPPRLAQITFTLTAKVQNLSQNKKVDVSASDTYALNSIDKTDKVEDLHLAKINGKYVIDLLGKTGESKPDRAVQVQLKHRDFREPVNVSLKTDGEGRVQLGFLPGIVVVTATGPEGTSHSWPLNGDRHSYHQSLHGVAGQPLEIPLVGHPQRPGIAGNPNEPERPARNEVSLLELRGGTFVTDRFENLIVEDSMLIARNLVPGDYDLWLKDKNRHITLRLAAGEAREGYVLGANRHLEIRDQSPLHIADVQTTDDALRIRLRNATKFARVHIFATRYAPAYDVYAHMAAIVDAEPYQITLGKTDARYVSGRNIGDELRYILDRRFATKFPGVMLERPGMLLNPWAVRTTQTGQQEAQAGGVFAPAPAAPKPDAMREDAKAANPESKAAPVTSNLDFLGESTAVVTNLVPDEKGMIVVARKDLGAHQHLHIVAVDPIDTAYHSVSLPEKEMKFRDLRLTKGLAPEKHFTQQKKITVVNADGKFTLADIATSKFEAYDSLARVYGLYVTLNRDANLVEFNFVTRWPQLKPEEKRAMYSKYACHELNFFLFKKDPEFFNGAIKPYLANKKDKTFLDRWLLAEPLDMYLKPWNYEQLNIVERILLAQRIAADHEQGTRDIRDLWAMLPPDIERFNLLFRTAIRGSALETSDALGIVAAVADAEAFAGKQLAGFGAIKLRSGADEPARFKKEQLSAEVESLDDAANKLAELKATAGAGVDKSEKGGGLGGGRSVRRSMLGLEKNGKADAYYNPDSESRKLGRQFFQQLEKTQEWAENNYYKLPIEQQNAELVTVNAFWRDYAAHDPSGKTPFYATTLAEASRNFTEMMFALALLDLPFEAGKHDSKFAETAMNLTAASPMIVFHEEIREAAAAPEKTPILVSQNFFNAHDRYRFENNEQLDKFVDEEFLVHTVYGCQVVVTNPTSAPQKLDVLTQIPLGAIVLSGGEATRSLHIQLQAFSTQTIEYYFYFPAAGKYPHYPVHVAKNEQLLASAQPVVLNVVEELSRLDRESWEYISQYGTNDQVLDFLRNANLHRLKLDKIAFRMQDPKFFAATIGLLGARHAYDHTLWSYSIKHNQVAAVREYLQHANDFVNQCGEYLDSKPLTIDPVVRKSYQHLEYLPLVNARAHQLGRRRQILNDRFVEQYHHMLKVLGYKRDFDNEDRLAVTYYLLLQDRVEDAGRFFDQVNADQLDSRLQYDYFAAYLSLCREDLAVAEQIAARYAQHPVDRWRNTFAMVKLQIDEVKGASSEVIDPQNRGQVQTQLASTEPNFEFQVESKKVTVNYQNLDRITVNYYLMDIELLFSRNPFVQTYGEQFAHIRPNLTQTIELPKGKSPHSFMLPEKLHTSNVLVEITAGGQTKSQPYYANSLALQLTENYGQLRVVTANPGKPLPKVYVKVYARMKDGSVRFFKDGYTDMRGRFDYGSLSTNELDFVDRFSLLILSDDHGAVVREATPPKQ